MYITKIKLKNFRCYENEEFSILDGAGLRKPLTLIYGLEGSGKTTVFNAVGWTLYGDETERLLNEQKQDLAIPNVNAFSNSNRAEVSVSVDMMFERDQEISRVRVTKKAEFLKGMSDASYAFSEASIFYRNGKTRNITEENNKAEFTNFMATYFPKQLLEFYMFTGEYLKRTYTTNGSNLQRGIMAQFKTGSIRHMADELSEIKEHFSKIARKKSKNQNLEAELKREQDSKSRLESQFKQNEIDISSLEEQVKKEEADIARYSEDYGRLKEKSERIKERDEISSSLRAKRGQIADLETSLYKTILEKAHFLNAGEKLTKVLMYIGDEVGKRKLPPDVEAPFVKSLLEEHICICGREIAFESEEEARLQHLLKEKEPEQGMEILTYLQGPVRIIQDSLVDWKNGIALIKANLEDAIRDATDLSAKLDAISDLEKGLNDAEKELKEKYESAYRRKSEIMGELELEKNRKERTGKELSDAGKRINEINEKIFEESEIGKDVEDAKNNYQIADLIQKALRQIPEDLFKTYAFRLQEKINDVLGSINVVSQFTTKVSYSERGLSFAFKELSPEFEELGAYMSGGQNQLVGICMMASFISVLGEIGRNVVEPPMVFMDHPISNLSDKGKALFQEKLTGIFKGIQLIVIATDGEVTGFLEHCGRGNISKVFKVEHDKSRKLSQKMEVE